MHGGCCVAHAVCQQCLGRAVRLCELCAGLHADEDDVQHERHMAACLRRCKAWAASVFGREKDMRLDFLLLLCDALVYSLMCMKWLMLQYPFAVPVK
jgi:hypothetical protein